MGIGIFRRPYTIRRRGDQKVVKGYAVGGNSEFTAKLNIQPLSAKELLALPEGERSVARVKAFGAVVLLSADEHTGTLGDLLYYEDRWYECKSCVHWLNTPLTHYEAEFVILADQSKQKPPKAGGDAL